MSPPFFSDYCCFRNTNFKSTYLDSSIFCLKSFKFKKKHFLFRISAQGFLQSEHLKNSENKKDLVKAWDKIKLNSFYETKSSDTFILYDESTSQKITEEGKKNLMVIQEAIKNC